MARAEVFAASRFSPFRSLGAGASAGLVTRFGGIGAGVPGTLTSLTLCAFEVVEIFSATRGAPGPAYPALGSVRHLALQAGRLELGRLELPALQSLHVRAGGLSREAVRAVVEADWPELETLTLWFGSVKSGADGAAGALAPLFSGERFPKLKHLRLQACEFADAAVGLLMGAPLLSRLESLDLSYGLLGDAGAEGLSQSAAKLGQLRQLTLVDTAMGATARETLRALGPHVKVENRELNPNDSVDHFVPSAAGDEFVYVFNVGTGSPPTPSPSGRAGVNIASPQGVPDYGTTRKERSPKQERSGAKGEE